MSLQNEPTSVSAKPRSERIASVGRMFFHERKLIAAHYSQEAAPNHKFTAWFEGGVTITATTPQEADALNDALKVYVREHYPMDNDPKGHRPLKSPLDE